MEAGDAITEGMRHKDCRLSGGETHDGWAGLLTQQVRERGRWYLHLAYRVVGDVEAAEDACQRAFCRAWERRDEIRDPNALRNWLARTVVNEALQLLRRRQIERRALAEQPNGEPATGPAEGVAQRDGVWRAVAMLEEPTRSIVVLRVVHGFSGNEVKRMFGCSAAEVSRRLHAGMAALRNQLTEFRDTTRDTNTEV